MDTIEHFKHLFEYNNWANSRLIFVEHAEVGWLTRAAGNIVLQALGKSV